MAFIKNVKAFSDITKGDTLVDLYRMLVAVELALKDANCNAGNGGHDVPAMLSMLANSSACQNFPAIASNLTGLASSLGGDLAAVLCQGLGGVPRNVPPHSYPYVRYARMSGDWGGVSETQQQHIVDLGATCFKILQLLKLQGKNIGVSI